MMDSISDMDSMGQNSSPPSSPVASGPPPPPATAPPDQQKTPPFEENASQPPEKPKKSRRTISPSKEGSGGGTLNSSGPKSLEKKHSSNGEGNGIGLDLGGEVNNWEVIGYENGDISNKHEDSSIEIVEKDTGVKTVNGIKNPVIKTNSTGNSRLEDEHGGGDDLVENGGDESFGSGGGGGGVAKIVGEIEKFNSIGKKAGRNDTSTPRKSLNLSNGENPNQHSKQDLDENSSLTTTFHHNNNSTSVDTNIMEDVQLRSRKKKSLSSSPPQKGLSPIEKSVLRELPVDVEIENDEEATENQRNILRQRKENRKSNQNTSATSSSSKKKNRNSSYMNESTENECSSPNRSGSGIKRTPTMEFKKQCSKIVRIRTKLLQNLGKADKTTDEVFDDYEVKFGKQQANANRLLKEVSNYLRCARALHGASKSLFETLSEVYEPEWSGHDQLYSHSQNSDMLWTDFVHKLQDQTLQPLTAYQIQFPELRKKIDKRGRKLVDYDSQRHQLEALQRNNRRDEYKMARCRDQLESARTTYDSLNKELYSELPGVYDQRVSRTAETLQTLYAAEATFMRESAKISQELDGITEKLRQESSLGHYATTRGSPITPRPVGYTTSSNTSNTQPTGGRGEEAGRPYEEIQFEETTKVNGGPPTSLTTTKTPTENMPKSDELYDIPIGATTTGLPAGVLYQVRSTYKYDREDVDELTFEVGELINVVEYEDPEEQEEGWLSGYKVSNNDKGLFPANFTRPI